MTASLGGLLIGWIVLAFVSTGAVGAAVDVDGPSGVVALPPGAAEDLGARTLHSKTFVLPDGQRATRISLSPLHYQDASGAWRDIDPTLVPAAGGFANTKNTFTTHLGLDGSVTVARAGASATWTPERLALRDASGATLAEQRAAATTVATLSGSSLSLAGLFADATDVHRVERSLVKNDLVLARAPFADKAAGAAVLVEEGRLVLSPGLTLRVDGAATTGVFATTGGVDVLLPDGTLAFRISGVFVHDARFPAAAAEGQTPTYVSGILRGTPTQNGLRLSVEVPAAWLYAPERAYPVTIDPTWGWDDVDASIYIRETEGNKNGDNFLKVGEEQGDWVFCCYYQDDYNRAFLRQSLAPLDNRIMGISEVRSDVYMYQWYSVSGTFQSYFVSSDTWNPATMTPSNQPGISTFLGSVAITSGGWKTTYLNTGSVEGQVNGDHVDLFNGDDTFSYSIRRSPEKENTDSAQWFYRTGTNAPEWLVTYSVDDVAPVTNHALSGTIGENSWFRSSVSVSLSCADTGSGCHTTQYRLNGGAWTTYTGTFSINAQGVTTLEYRSQDKVLNWNTVTSVPVKIDTVVPSTTSTITGTLGGGGWYTSSPQVTLGCADASSGCSMSEYRINGGAWNTYVGAFSVTTPGSNTVDYRSRDEAGNWNSVATITVKVDTVLPLVSHALSGTLGGNGWYRSTPTVTLSSSDDHSGISSVEYRLNGGLWTAYSAPFSVPAEGTNTLDYRATDVAGNVRTVTGNTVRVDLTPPSIVRALDGVLGNAGWYVSQVGVTLTGSDAHSGLSNMEYRLDGGAWTAYTTQFTLTANGVRTVEYRGTDVAGNVAAITTANPKIDTVLPVTVAGITGTLGLNGWYTTPVSLTLTASDATSGVSEVRHRVNGGPWQTYASPVSITNQGTTTIEYYAIDAAGNAEAPKSSSIKVDSVLPTTVRALAGTLGSHGWYTSPVDVTLSATDATSGVQRTEYRIDGGAWQTYTAPFRVEGDGVHVVEYRSADYAGNVESVISFNLAIDTVTPTVSALLDGLLGQLGWYLSEVEATLAAADGASGVDRIYYRIGSGGDWTLYTAPFTMGNSGTTTFSAYATDRAGNVGQATTWTVKIDRIVPLTSRILDGTQGLAEWFRSDVGVALSCTDTPSGCARTIWRVDEDDWAAYEGSFTLVSEGISTLEAYSVDVAGNAETPVAGQVKIDKTPPASVADLFPVPNAAGWIREPGTVTITATDALSGVHRISHRLNGGAWTDGTSLGVAADGIHTVGHRALDVAGNQEADRSLTVRLDTTPPLTTISLSPLPNANGWNAGDVLVTLASTDALSGVDQTFARIDGGGWFGGTSFVVTGDLVHTVEFYAVDVAGNAEGVKNAPVRIDTTPPSVAGTLDGLLGNEGWYRSAVQVAATATDALSGVDAIRIAVDGGAETAYTAPVSVTGDGSHEAALRAIDRAGVSSGVTTLGLRIDATTPLTTSALSGPLGGAGWYLGDVTVSLAATDATSGVAGTSYDVDGGPRLDYAAPFVVTGDGVHAVRHGSVDVAGNTETDGTTNVRIDTTPPSLVATLLGTLGDQSWFVGPVTVRVDATDAHSGVATIEVSVDGGAWVPYDPAATIGTSGTHTVLFRATDRAGNAAPAGSTTFRIDVDLPVTVPTLTGPQGLAGWFVGAVDLRLAATDATSGVSVIRYQVDGGAFRVYSGPVPIVPDGEHTVRYFAQDAAGNVEDARTLVFRIDATLPESVRAVTGLVGNLGWHVGPVSVSVSASDAMSGVSHVLQRVDGGDWTTYDGAIALTTDGLHAVEHRAVDVAGNTEAAQRVELRLDQLAPVTSVTLTGPLGSGGWFTGAVSAALAAVDATSGVAGIEWSLDNGPWTPYDGPIDIVGDGAHELRWRATDVAGNVEETRSVSLQIDATLPSATLSIVGPLVEDVRAFVTSATRFVFTAVDAGSGASEVRYRLDGGAWQTYTEPFGLPPGEVTHTIEFYAVDAAGNAEPARVREIVLDDTGPATTLDLIGPKLVAALVTYVHPTTQFVMSATDGALGSGVAEIRYAIDPAADRAYLPFFLEGADGARTIRYWAVDRLGNVAPAATFDAFLDATAPIPDLVVGDPSFVATNGDRFVTSATPLDVVASDPATGGGAAGVTLIEYRVGAGAWKPFTGSFQVPATPGEVSVSVRARDAVGNLAPARTFTLLVDDVAPELSIVTPRPGSVTSQGGYFETDSDADGFADLVELALGTDPHDAGSNPGQTGLGLAIEEDAGDAIRAAQQRAYAIEGSIVLFDLAANDVAAPASGVASLVVTVNGETVATLIEEPYTWAFDTTGLTLGVYLVEITATDAVDNAAKVTMEVHVLPASLETAAATLADTMEGAGEGAANLGRTRKSL